MQWILFIILMIAIAIAYSFRERLAEIGAGVASAVRGFMGTPVPQISGGDESPTDMAREIARKFATEPFLAADAERASGLADDISADISSPPTNPSELQVAKAVADLAANYFVYQKRPNPISREAMVVDRAIITGALEPPARHAAAAKALPADILRKMVEASAVKKSPQETDERPTAADLNRRFHISKLAAPDDICAEPMTRLKMEIRERNTEIDKLRAENSHLRSGELAGRGLLDRTDPLRAVRTDLTSDLLADCNRERRQLQELVYDLRREVGRAKPGDSDALSRCSAEKAQLEARLQSLSASVGQESREISSLQQQLRECERLIGEILDAK